MPWCSAGVKAIAPAASITPVTVDPVSEQLGCESVPKAVIVYGPRIEGGGPVPGEPSKVMPAGEVPVQAEPVQLVVVSTFWPLWVFVVGDCPSTVVVWVAVQYPDVLQAPCTLLL